MGSRRTQDDCITGKSPLEQTRQIGVIVILSTRTKGQGQIGTGTEFFQRRLVHFGNIVLLLLHVVVVVVVIVVVVVWIVGSAHQLRTQKSAVLMNQVIHAT